MERYKRMESMIAEMDKNKNGYLEESELESRERYYAERTLQRAGMEVKYPIATSLAKQAAAKYYGVTSTGASGAVAALGSISGEGTFTGLSGQGQPLVPGFGAPPPPAAPVLGFGVPSPTIALSVSAMPTSTSTTSSSSSSRSSESSRDRDDHSSSNSSSSGGSSTSLSSDEIRKYRDYAQSIMRQYDSDKDGTLSNDECGKMKNNPYPAADKDNDRRVTLDELTNWLVDYVRSRRSSSRSSSSGSSAARIRFLSPVERLPSGLPEWFGDRDANEDGQVAMAEFTRDWNESELSRYLRYDLNNDGVITPKECLAAESNEGDQDRGRGDERSGGDQRSGGDDRSRGEDRGGDDRSRGEDRDRDRGRD